MSLEGLEKFFDFEFCLQNQNLPLPLFRGSQLSQSTSSQPSPASTWRSALSPSTLSVSFVVSSLAAEHPAHVGLRGRAVAPLGASVVAAAQDLVLHTRVGLRGSIVFLGGDFRPPEVLSRFQPKPRQSVALCGKPCRTRGGNQKPCVFPRSRLRFALDAGSKAGAVQALSLRGVGRSAMTAVLHARDAFCVLVRQASPGAARAGRRDVAAVRRLVVVVHRARAWEQASVHEAS